ncbi:MAG: regulatory protein RecX [Candidatus Xenobium sp.]|jgi:regulatory protein|nr:regulatory protein RecX [Burkholderiales bacterium]
MDLRERALRILQVRDHSCEELRRKLLARGLGPEGLDSLLEDLVRLGYLDDYRFAVQFVRERTSRGRGRLRVARELEQRGVDAELARQVLEEVLPDQECETARALAERRARAGRSPQSTARFLASRGFSAATIRQVLAQVFPDD